MKKSIVIFLFVLLSAGCLYAEEERQGFEEKHKDKDVIFLEDSITIKLNPDWSYAKEEHRIMKIQKEEARYLGEIPIYYEKDRENISEISAWTITPDGKKHKFTKIQDKSEYDSSPVYSDSRVKIITMPQVNIGSIIEMKVVTESKGRPIENSYWEVMYFLTSSPTKLLKAKFIFPKELGIQYKEFNPTHKPEITEDDLNITYSWEIQDVYDERKSEGYTPPPALSDMINVVEFSSIKTWSDISDWGYGLVQKNLKITPDIEQAAHKAIEGKASLKDKTRAILEYIQDNFRYVSMSFGTHSFEPHPTDEVFNNKYGDCKDLSLLCMAMLKITGIESSLALFKDEFSTTDPQSDMPIPTVFDHVLVLVRDDRDGDFYIDPLLKGYDIGEYPLYYNNAYTFIITDEGGRFDRFPIFSEEREHDKTETNIAIHEDGSSLVETLSLWGLDDSIEARWRFREMDETEKKEYYEYFDAYIAYGGEVLERRIDNLDARYGKLSSYLKTRQRDAYLVSDGLIVLDISGYNRVMGFAKDERENPIFYPGNNCSEGITTYHIPEGFRVLSLPKDIERDMGFFSAKREYKKDKNKIIVHEIRRNRRLEIPKEEYAKVKEFFDGLPRGTHQRIILKKTGSFWEGFILDSF